MADNYRKIPGHLKFIPLTLKLIFNRYYDKNKNEFKPIYYSCENGGKPTGKNGPYLPFEPDDKLNPKLVFSNIFIPTGELLEVDINKIKQTLHKNWLQNYKDGPYKSSDNTNTFYYLLGFHKYNDDSKFKLTYLQICSKPLNYVSDNCINISNWVEKYPQTEKYTNITHSSLTTAYKEYELLKKYQEMFSKNKIKFTRLTLTLIANNYKNKIIKAYKRNIIGIDPTSDAGPYVEIKHLNNRKKIFDIKLKSTNILFEYDHQTKQLTRYQNWTNKIDKIITNFQNKNATLYLRCMIQEYTTSSEDKWTKYDFPITIDDNNYYVSRFWIEQP